MAAQAVGPPSERRATSGPSTKNGASTTRLSIDRCRTLAHSQERLRNSLQPAASWARKLVSWPIRTVPAGRSRASDQALTAKLPASTARAAAGPAVTTSTPAPTWPPMPLALRDSPIRALAC